MTDSRPWAMALLLGVAMLAPRAEAGKLLAVLPIDVRHTHGRMTKDDEVSLEEMLRDVASNALPGWTVMTGATTLQLLEDNGIDPTKCTETSCELSTARQVEADKFFSGAVEFVDSEYTASIRLMDTKTGRILAAARLRGRTTLALEDAFTKQAPEFFARAGLSGAPGTGATLPAMSVGAGPALPAVPSVSANLSSSALDLNASTDALVARDAALKADANGSSDPTAAADAWEDLAKIKDGNPYRREAAKRAVKWREFAEQKKQLAAQQAKDTKRLKRLLPLTSIDAKTKKALLDRFAAAYGEAAAAPLRALAVGGGETRTEPKAGYVFVHLPGGTFTMGCEPNDTQCDDDEKPAKQVTVASFWLGKNDVTAGQYKKCADAGACTAANTGQWCTYNANEDDHPINCVDWNQAVAFCQWIGGRLPTAEEWEYAAKSGEYRIYPWGNEPPTAQLAKFSSSDGTDTVGTHPAGATKRGLLDMAGNVWQWTASNYDASNKEIRGGSWFNISRVLRASGRDRDEPRNRLSGLGFRCGL